MVGPILLSATHLDIILAMAGAIIGLTWRQVKEHRVDWIASLADERTDKLSGLTFRLAAIVLETPKFFKIKYHFTYLHSVIFWLN